MTIEPATLDGQIQALLDEMQLEDKCTDKYAQMADQLVKLYTLKMNDKSKRVSADAVLSVAGNLTAILLVLNYEKANVIASKAFGFIRPKI